MRFLCILFILKFSKKYYNIIQCFDIGRSSLREAMKLLASRNIVTIRQGSGTYVASSPGLIDDPFGFTFISDKKSLCRICSI